MSVRPATAADADAIGIVHAESWRGVYSGVLPERAFDVAARQRWWRGVFADDRPSTSAVFVA